VYDATPQRRREQLLDKARAGHFMQKLADAIPASSHPVEWAPGVDHGRGRTASDRRHGRHHGGDAMSTQAEATALANIDPTLRCLARLLPYRYGLFARHLRVMRAQTSLMGLLQAARDVDVVAVSPTASVRVHRPHGLAGNSPAVLWIHGGGYVAGCARMDERLVVKTAHELGALSSAWNTGSPPSILTRQHWTTATPRCDGWPRERTLTDHEYCSPAYQPVGV
jgi:hypothetical protein